VQVQTDVEDSFQPWVNYKEAQKEKRNYNMPPGINRQHPKKDCIQSGKLPPAARSGAVALPQSQPGTKPLGWAGGFRATLLLQKILSRRKRLVQILASSTTWPPFWPWIATARRGQHGEDAVDSQITRSSQMPLLAPVTTGPPLTTTSPPRPAWWARSSRWIPEKQRPHPRLRIRVLSPSLSAHLHLPSPPRQAGGIGRDGAGQASHRSAQRSRARTGAPSLPPDPTEAAGSLSLPSPPRQARERESGGDSRDEEEAADHELIRRCGGCRHRLALQPKE
jgi:hypothetical protein